MSDSHNGLYLYADDAKLFYIGSNFVNLQAALDKLSIWLQKRQLDLAASKCDHLCVTCARLTAPDNSFYIGCHNIHNVSFVKDLGIFIDKDLKFSYHIKLHFTQCFALCLSNFAFFLHQKCMDFA